MTPAEVRMVVRRTVDRFGTVRAADMAGVPVETIRWWLVLPDGADEKDMPAHGTLRALRAQDCPS